MRLVYDVAHNIAKMETYEVDGERANALRAPQGGDAGVSGGPSGGAGAVSAGRPAGAGPRRHGARKLGTGRAGRRDGPDVRQLLPRGGAADVARGRDSRRQGPLDREGITRSAASSRGPAGVRVWPRSSRRRTRTWARSSTLYRPPASAARWPVCDRSGSSRASERESQRVPADVERGQCAGRIRQRTAASSVSGDTARDRVADRATSAATTHLARVCGGGGGPAVGAGVPNMRGYRHRNDG